MSDSNVYDLATGTATPDAVLYLVQGNGTLDRKITLGRLYQLWDTLAPTGTHTIVWGAGNNLEWGAGSELEFGASATSVDWGSGVPLNWGGGNTVEWG